MPTTGVLPTKAKYYKIIDRQTGHYSMKGMWGWDTAGYIFTSMTQAKRHITRCINYYTKYYRFSKTCDEYKSVDLQYVDLIEVDIIEKRMSNLKVIHEKKEQDKLDKIKLKAEHIANKIKKAEEKERKRLEKIGLVPEPAKVTLRL